MSKVPLNASDATAISFADWMQCGNELDSERTGNADVRLAKISDSQVPGCDLFSLGYENSDRHEMWMCTLPGKGSFFRVEKTVNDDRVSLS